MMQVTPVPWTWVGGRRALERAHQGFTSLVDTKIGASVTLGDFYNKLRQQRAVVHELKSKLRELFQDIYRAYAMRYGLIRIPVYIPDKYKITRTGAVVSVRGAPKSIVVYYLKSPYYVKRDDKLPVGFRTRTLDEMLETLRHEIAHVLDLKRRGFSRHDINFMQAMTEVTNFMEMALR